MHGGRWAAIHPLPAESSPDAPLLPQVTMLRPLRAPGSLQHKDTSARLYGAVARHPPVKTDECARAGNHYDDSPLTLVGDISNALDAARVFHV